MDYKSKGPQVEHKKKELEPYQTAHTAAYATVRAIAKRYGMNYPGQTVTGLKEIIKPKKKQDRALISWIEQKAREHFNRGILQP